MSAETAFYIGYVAGGLTGMGVISFGFWYTYGSRLRAKNEGGR